MMRTFLREQLSAVLEFLAQVIVNPQALSEETFFQAFSASNHWCDFSTKTFIPHEGFMTQIFNFLNTPVAVHGVNMQMKVVKIIKKLLDKNTKAKLLENVGNFRTAMSEIPPKDQQFL
jgi:hypothetical protein